MNAQNDLQYCKSKVRPNASQNGNHNIINIELSHYLCRKDSSGSDNDSALSSAPPSLSPQPGTQSNTSDVWQAVRAKNHLLFIIQYLYSACARSMAQTPGVVPESHIQLSIRTMIITENNYLFISIISFQLLKESKDHENLQKEYDLIKEENQFLNCEITLAEEQIRELEKVIQMVSSTVCSLSSVGRVCVWSHEQ